MAAQERKQKCTYPRCAPIRERFERIVDQKDVLRLEISVDDVVVVEVLDAHDPLAYRSSHVEEVVKGKDGKKMMLVLNKIGASRM